MSLEGKIVEKIRAKNGKEVIIRYPKFSDWKDLLSHINLLVEEDAKILVNKKLKKEDEIDYISNVLKEVELGNAVYLVAEVEGKVIGTCEIKRRKFRESHTGIYGISIRKGYRGIGIGKAISKACLREAKKRLKLKVVYLEVFENNKPAIALYKKLGFKICGKYPKKVKYKKRLIDSIIMYKFLN